MGVAVVGQPREIPGVAVVLASHARMHACEGEQYRRGIVEAANDLGLPVLRIGPDELTARTTELLELDAGADRAGARRRPGGARRPVADGPQAGCARRPDAAALAARPLSSSPPGGRDERGVTHVVPGLATLRSYQRRWLRIDLVAGVVLAAILVPQGMAYAELAGLPPVNGLYTTIACLVGYALMGPSRILVLGPDSSLGPLIFAAITPLVVAGDDPATAIALAGMLAILVGLIEIGLGVGKLGFVADLLSKEVQVGYMNGLAITIIVGQLPKLCGFSTDADGFVDEVRAFVTTSTSATRTALAVGLATLAVLLVLPRVTPARCRPCSSPSSARPS